MAGLHVDAHSLPQVVTVALDAAVMEACVRLRGPAPCVLDSWNTSRLTGALQSVRPHVALLHHSRMLAFRGVLCTACAAAFPAKNSLFDPLWSIRRTEEQRTMDALEPPAGTTRAIPGRLGCCFAGLRRGELVRDILQQVISRRARHDYGDSQD